MYACRCFNDDVWVFAPGLNLSVPYRTRPTNRNVTVPYNANLKSISCPVGAARHVSLCVDVLSIQDADRPHPILNCINSFTSTEQSCILVR